MQQEIERTQAIGAKDIVLHPGAHVGAGVDAGINKIIEGLNEVLTNDKNYVLRLKRWQVKVQRLVAHLKS